MKFAFSINGVPIRLSKERMKHIVNRHPEMKNQEDRILETISNPDAVQKGDAGALIAVKAFEDTPVKNDKYLCVAYKEVAESDGFVLTAYYSTLLRRRMIIWKR